MEWIIIPIVIVIICIYLFLIAPSGRKHDAFREIEGKMIYHRGNHSPDVPENSIPAFQNAVNDCTAIELDIHLTKDKNVVVFHDSSLKRMCGRDIAPEKLTLEQLENINLSGTVHKIPSLESVLKTVDGKVPLLIEYKESDGNAGELCERADELLKDYRGVYIVQSFYPSVLRWFRKNRPEICRGQLTSATAVVGIKGFILSTLMVNCISRPDFISCSYKSVGLSRFLNKLMGAKVVGWTFRNEDAVKKNSSRFCSYICENISPEIVKKV